MIGDMTPDLEDIIERAAGLSRNGGLQITVRADRGASVHYIDPNSGRLEKTNAPSVRLALEEALDEMLGESE